MHLAPFKHNHAVQLSCITPDRNGEVPDLDVVGKTYVHTPTGKPYKVIGYTFLGDMDEWAYTMEEFEGACQVTRTIRNFNSVKNGSPLRRFMLRQEVGPGTN